MDRLRNFVSHRVTFEYEDGTMLTGYVAACRPAEGPVRVVALNRVEITDATGKILEQHRELVVVPSVLIDYRVAEGPSAQLNP